MDELTEKFMKKMEEYDKVFKGRGGFPTIPLLDYGEERCIEMIDQCLAAKKDVIEMGFYYQDNDIKY